MICTGHPALVVADRCVSREPARIQTLRHALYGSNPGYPPGRAPASILATDSTVPSRSDVSGRRTPVSPTHGRPVTGMKILAQLVHTALRWLGRSSRIAPIYQRSRLIPSRHA